MDPRLKKAGMLLGLLVATGLIGYGLYRVFFASQEPEVIVNSPDTLVNGLPRAGGSTTTGSDVIPPGTLTGAGERPPTDDDFLREDEGDPGVISSLPRATVVRNTLTTQLSGSTSGGSLRSYSPTDGKFYKILEDGSVFPLSDKVFYSVEKVAWANKSDQAVLSFPDGSKVLYDFITDQQKTLPRYWDGFSFSPDDSQLVTKSVGNDPSNRFLIIANPENGEQRAIEDLGENQDKVHVSWSPNNQTIAYAFTGDPIGQNEQAVVLVGQHQENFKNLIVDGRGFTPSWSPSGNAIVYSVWNSDGGYRPELWFSRADGENINGGRLDLRLQTWGDKCAWQSESIVICAVPVNMREGAGLQRESFDRGPDTIYRLDLKSGQKANLGPPGVDPISVQQISAVSENKVFLTDKLTGKLISFDTN